MGLKSNNNLSLSLQTLMKMLLMGMAAAKTTTPPDWQHWTWKSDPRTTSGGGERRGRQRPTRTPTRNNSRDNHGPRDWERTTETTSRGDPRSCQHHQHHLPHLGLSRYPHHHRAKDATTVRKLSKTRTKKECVINFEYLHNTKEIMNALSKCTLCCVQ